MTSKQGVAGQWMGNLAIGGQEMSMSPTNMPMLQVFNNIHQYLPSLKLQIKDNSTLLLEKIGLADGTKISLQLGDGKSTAMTPEMTFKVVGDPEAADTPMGEIFTISAVLDNVEWLRKVATGAFKGTSSNVVGELAKQAGLKFDGDSASDSMTWLTNNKTLAGMAHHVKERAWASSTSGFMLGVRDNATAVMKNVDTFMGNAGTLFGVNGIPVIEKKIASKGAVNNNYVGYGATSIELNPKNSFMEFNKVATTLLNGRNSISSLMQQSVGDLGGRIMPQILNSGNVHEKFYEALHQNKRVLSTYSRDVELLVDVMSGVNILDSASLNLQSNSYFMLNSLRGSYVVSSLNRVIQNNRYLEKLTVTSQ